MESLPVVTINNETAPFLPPLPPVPMLSNSVNSLPMATTTHLPAPLGQINSEPCPMLNGMAGFTPMLLTTDSNGYQTLTPISRSSVSPDPNFWPMMPVMLTSPSTSPSPRLCNTGCLTLPISCSPSNSSEGFDLSLSREREGDLHIIEPFETERKEAVVNEDNIPIPTIKQEMTKKDLVNATLDWFYEVLGSEHFDCEGRRGKNVLRIKVKTRGALEYICPLIEQCIEEGLLYHVSCPISTKKQRRHIRGYLAYLEGVSETATDRMIEIFNELNKDYVTNCDGILEHPFKGISRNPIAVRHINGIAA